MITQTKRLWLRKMDMQDLHALCAILQDAEVMYAYEHAFSDAEVHAWIANQLRRYREDGFGLWAVIRKSDSRLIGQCGITLQPCQGETVKEVGYLFAKDCWHQGYALEAAHACCTYAFENLDAQEVYAIIRENNEASKRVAKRLGMREKTRICKHYYHMDMVHIAYAITKEAFR